MGQEGNVVIDQIEYIRKNMRGKRRKLNRVRDVNITSGVRGCPVTE